MAHNHKDFMPLISNSAGDTDVEWNDLVLRHVLQRIDAAELNLQPFPHLIIRDLLPSDCHRDFLRQSPQLADTAKYGSGTYQHESDSKISFIPRTAAYEQLLSERPALAGYARVVGSDSVWQCLRTKFGETLREHLAVDLSTVDPRKETVFSASTSGYRKAIHVDRRDHIFNILYYGSGSPGEGGELRLHGLKSPSTETAADLSSPAASGFGETQDFSTSIGASPGWEAVFAEDAKCYDIFPAEDTTTIAVQLKPLPNDCVIFLNCPCSYHSVTENVCPPGKERLYSYTVFDYVETASEAQSAAAEGAMDRSATVVQERSAGKNADLGLWRASYKVFSEERRRKFLNIVTSSE